MSRRTPGPEGVDDSLEVEDDAVDALDAVDDTTPADPELETDAPELMRVVIDEVAKATETINEAEIAKAKAQMKAGLLMALESSEARLG